MPKASLGGRVLGRALVAFTVSSWLAAACNNGYPVAPIPDGDAVCAELVQYCAAPAAALGEPYQSCYDTGMHGKASACLNVEDDCVNPCYDANAGLPPPAGEGGAAGAAGSNGGAISDGGAGNEAGAAGDTSASAGGASGRAGS